MKRLATHILGILNSKEKLRLAILILLDLLIGVLDIAFLAILLIIINCYTKTALPGKFLLWYLPANRPLWLPGAFVLLFLVKNCVGYLIAQAQSTFFFRVASRLGIALG